MLESTNLLAILVIAILFNSLAHANQKPNKLSSKLDKVNHLSQHLSRRDVSATQKNSLLSSSVKEGSVSSRGNHFAPSKLKSILVPLTLDVSGDRELIKVQSSFQPVYLNKSYHLDVELNQDTTKLHERCFDYPAEKAIYTLKQLYTIDQYACSSMCYNIEDWDSLGVSEQTCISLSYCIPTRVCTLLIKTDYSFSTKLDYSQDEQEQQVVASVDSASELMRESKGCSVSIRDFMENFERPIRLAPNNFAYKTTESRLAMKYEWLASFRVMETDYNRDFQSRCANKCHEENSKPGERVCLALDFCTRYYLSSEQENPKKGTYEITCNLFLVSSEAMSGFEGADKLDKIRRVLEKPQRQASNVTNPMYDTQLCNRFLLSSSLYQFNHLNQRRLSDKFGSLLTKSLHTLKDVKLDKCASDCSLQPGDCFLFEYCNEPVQNTETSGKTCKLYGKPEGSVESETDRTAVNETLLISYDGHCHIYVRKDVGTLGTLYSLRSRAWGYSLNDFSTTIFALLLLLFPLVTSVVLVAFEKSDCLTNRLF